MILITGAAGKTGLAVLKALVRRGISVRVLVRRQAQAERLIREGAAEAVTGDMTAAESYRQAMDGVRSVYHICPNMHPGETEIGRLAINTAYRYRIGHFVYHSVLHPQTEKMPHHWQKMRVEEELFESGLDFTILQPAPYMQNIRASRSSIINEGLFQAPYPVESRFGLLDLEDLGEAAAIVLTESGHKGATYELVGTPTLSQAEMTSLIGTVLERNITFEEITIERWQKDAEKAGLGQYALDTLQKMFLYYAQYGLDGNSFVLRSLIGREPYSLADFIKREFL